jgi:soluble lytic murein transglycosylase
LGLPEDAGRELTSARIGDDPRVRIEFARLDAHAGLPNPALRLAEASKAYLARYGATFGYEPLRWRMPRGYEAIVRENARATGLAPGLVWALIQRESRFAPGAVSPVGAVGLMQLMPETARRIAQEMGDKDFDADRVREPEVNVRYGCRYLQGLLQRYGGRTGIAAAAYNAGEDAVDRWLRVRGDIAPDVFVEEIPYKETRAYAMDVQRDFALYGWLYGAER